MNLQHVWTALLALVPLGVGVFYPGLQDATHNFLIAVGTFVGIIFGGHVVGQAHAARRARSSV